MTFERHRNSPPIMVLLALHRNIFFLLFQMLTNLRILFLLQREIPLQALAIKSYVHISSFLVDGVGWQLSHALQPAVEVGELLLVDWNQLTARLYQTPQGQIAKRHLVASQVFVTGQKYFDGFISAKHFLLRRRCDLRIGAEHYGHKNLKASREQIARDIKQALVDLRPQLKIFRVQRIASCILFDHVDRDRVRVKNLRFSINQSGDS